jgi:hypothetical protein
MKLPSVRLIFDKAVESHSAWLGVSELEVQYSTFMVMMSLYFCCVLPCASRYDLCIFSPPSAWQEWRQESVFRMEEPIGRDSRFSPDVCIS